MSSTAHVPTDRLVPKLFTVLRQGYTRVQLGHDVAAGVLVGVLALPLAIAFGIASGVKPEQGLATAIVAGFIISAFGGSRVQIGGPTGAFVVLVYDIVQRHGYEGLAVATGLAGLLLIGMGLARLGTVIQFVPYPLTVGFTSGIALIIALTQVRDLLGLRMESVPGAFFGRLAAYAGAIATWNPWAVGVGLLSTILVWQWPRVTRRVPGALVAVLVCTVLVHALNVPVETIGDRFGAVPSGLRAPALPHFDLALMRDVAPAALSIALLAAIESLLSAVVADGMAGTRHRSNMELIAQGAANLVSPLFGGIPATGAIARTATNVRAGGRTPVAGIVHAFTLLLILLFVGKWAALIPMAALAGILLVVAANMSEWRRFLRLFKSPRSDVLVLITTFLLTVVVDLTFALQVGMILAAFLFMRRMAAVSEAGYMGAEEEDDAERLRNESLVIPKGVEVFKVFGTLFFGAAAKFKDALRRVEAPPKVLILRLRDVLAIDATGLDALDEVVDQAKRDGTTILLTGVNPQPLSALRRAGTLDRIGQQNVYADIDRALVRARQIVGVATGVPVSPPGPRS